MCAPLEFLTDSTYFNHTTKILRTTKFFLSHFLGPGSLKRPNQLVPNNKSSKIPETVKKPEHPKPEKQQIANGPQSLGKGPSKPSVGNGPIQPITLPNGSAKGDQSIHPSSIHQSNKVQSNTNSQNQAEKFSNQANRSTPHQSLNKQPQLNKMENSQVVQSTHQLQNKMADSSRGVQHQHQNKMADSSRGVHNQQQNKMADSSQGVHNQQQNKMADSSRGVHNQQQNKMADSSQGVHNQQQNKMADSSQSVNQKQLYSNIKQQNNTIVEEKVRNYEANHSNIKGRGQIYFRYRVSFNCLQPVFGCISNNMKDIREVI